MENYNTFEEKRDVLFEAANELAKLIGMAWDIIFEKWPVSKEMWVEEGDEEILTFYNANFHIQRTMGAFALNSIICKSLSETGGLDIFKDILEKCTLTTDDWSTMGAFAGLNSQGGIKKIKDAVLKDYEDSKV